MVLESIYWENLELAVLVSDNTDESILQGQALANESALVQVILIDVVDCLAFFLDPALLGVVWAVAVEAHADSLVAQELLFGIVVAEC